MDSTQVSGADLWAAPREVMMAAASSWGEANRPSAERCPTHVTTTAVPSLNQPRSSSSRAQVQPLKPAPGGCVLRLFHAFARAVKL